MRVIEVFFSLLSQDLNAKMSIHRIVLLAQYILIWLWHVPMLCTVTPTSSRSWKRPLNSASLTMFISSLHGFDQCVKKTKKKKNTSITELWKTAAAFCPNFQLLQETHSVGPFLLLLLSSRSAPLCWSARICACAIWTSAFVATSVRAMKPCRQGRSPETDTPGVCSSSPPFSLHSHPSGSTLLPLSFRTRLLSSKLEAHWDLVKIRIHASKFVCVSALEWGPQHV